MKVCLGGTFSILHSGHEALLRKAFDLGSDVTIGLTTDRMAKKMRKTTGTYEKRKQKLEEFIFDKFRRAASVVPLDDPYGPAVEGGFDAIVVSPETVKGAEIINRERREGGMKELDVIKVPFVFANDGIPISSSRIMRGELDDGMRLTSLSVRVNSSDREKNLGTKKAFEKLLSGIDVKFDNERADYIVEFESGKCIIKDITGYTTTGKNVEEALLARLNH
jgi:pantetheine-phosphate adenylyltransferase